MSNTVKIHVLPKVRQYLLSEHGAEPIYVRSDSFLGSVFSLAMEKIPVDPLARKEPIKGGVPVEFRLSEDLYNGMLTQHTRNNLARVFEQQARHHLCACVSFAAFFTRNREGAAKVYLKLHGLEEHIEPNTAGRMVSRTLRKTSKNFAGKQKNLGDPVRKKGEVVRLGGVMSEQIA